MITNLDQECGDIAEDECRCYLPGVYDRVLCTDVGDEASVGDVVEGEKRGWRADDKKLLYGEDTNAFWAVFGHASENKTECFAWIKRGVRSRYVRK